MQKPASVRGQDLCCLMSKPADKPEVVQLPAEPPVAVPASQPPGRRAAGARGARSVNVDQRNPPRFRPRTAPAICPDPDVGILCRDAAGGGNRPAVRLLDAAGFGRGLDLRHALHPRRHHPQLRQIPRRAGLARPRPANGERGLCCSTCSTACAGPSILIHPAGLDVVSEHADDVPDAAGDRGIEHARGQPADRSACGDRRR